MVPWVLETRVFPIFLTLKADGALISYQSFFEKGSTLHQTIQKREKVETFPNQISKFTENDKGAIFLLKLTSSFCLPSYPWRSSCFFCKQESRDQKVGEQREEELREVDEILTRPPWLLLLRSLRVRVRRTGRRTRE